MANPAKAKGTAWETAVVRYLTERGIPARRNPQHGAKDIGDIGGVPGFALEAKAEKSYSFAAYVAQARVEARNAGEPFGAAVVKRHRAPVEDGYVVMDLETFADLLPYIEAGLAAEEGADLDSLFDDVDHSRPWVYLDEVEDRLRRTLERGPRL